MDCPVGPKCNHKCPYKREAEGSFTTEEGSMITEADATPLALKMEKGP